MDNHKKVKGRKRHIVVDTLGNLLVAVVHSAGVQDYHGARAVLTQLGQQDWPRLRKLWADAIYKGDKGLQAWVQNTFGWDVVVVERDPGVKGFQPLPRRWVIERTLAWFGRHRRLSKDGELLSRHSETWLYVAMSGLLVRRLALSP